MQNKCMFTRSTWLGVFQNMCKTGMLAVNPIQSDTHRIELQHNPGYNKQVAILFDQNLISIAEGFDQPMTKYYDKITYYMNYMYNILQPMYNQPAKSEQHLVLECLRYTRNIPHHSYLADTSMRKSWGISSCWIAFVSVEKNNCCHGARFNHLGFKHSLVRIWFMIPITETSVARYLNFRQIMEMLVVIFR